MQGLVAFVRTLGATRIAAMAAVSLSLVAFFAFLIVRVTTPEMTALYTGLSLEDSAAIVKELDRQGVTYQIKDDGATIMVPQSDVARLRMRLAEDGIPKGGGVGYEIFDKSDALGATSFVQNINKLRALEGELARTIRTLDRVAMARVHLVLPERPLFSREQVEPSASIALKVRGSLAAQEVRAIRHLVATRRARAQARTHFDRRRHRPAARRRRRRRPRRARHRRRRASGRPSRSARANRSTASSPRWSAPAARAFRSPPISISTASPRPPTNTIRTAGSCAPARPMRKAPVRSAGRDNGAVTVSNELPGGNTQQQQNGSSPRIRPRKPTRPSITRFPTRPRPR